MYFSLTQDNFKLGDFGSATTLPPHGHVGTLDYAAPELLAQNTYDTPIDIWSLGCIAYEVQAGRPPFYHINPEETRRLIMRVFLTSLRGSMKLP